MGWFAKPYFSALERFLKPMRSSKPLTPSQAAELAKHQRIEHARDTPVQQQNAQKDLDDLMR